MSPVAPMSATAGAGQHVVDLASAPGVGPDGQQMVDVIAKVNPDTNEPVLGDTTLILGDGSVKVRFVRGRARVSAEIAEVLKNRSDLDMPGIGHYGGGHSIVRAAGIAHASTAEELTAEGPPEGLDEEQVAELAGLQTAVGEKDEALAAAQAEIERLKAKLAEDEATDEEEKLRLAREHLAGEDDESDEGEDEGEGNAAPARASVPDGFDAKTAEDELRCLAKTSSGSQCKNPAKDGGSACGLEPHQAQFAS